MSEEKLFPNTVSDNVNHNEDVSNTNCRSDARSSEKSREEDVFVVEKIINKRIKKNKVEYYCLKNINIEVERL